MQDKTNSQVKPGYWLAASGTLFAVLVIVLGAFTRLVDAGLGCPDWPGCYGHILWPMDEAEVAAADAAFPEAPVEHDKTWPEQVHRLLATSLGLFCIAFVGMAYRQRQNGLNAPIKLSLVLLAMVIVQGMFGRWTVTLNLWPQVVTAHLIGGFTTLSLMWLLFLRQGGLSDMVSALPRPNWLAKIAFVAVVVQIILGGWVSSNYAALACYDFPSCDGTYTPNIDLQQGFNIFQSVGPNYLGGLMTNEARMAIHWVHRIGAIVVLLVVGGLVIQTVKQAAVMGYVLLAVLVTQITLGILNVVWVLPLLNATAHNTVGALLLLVLVTINFAPRLRIVQS